MLTVDAPLVGRRERDARNRFGLPHGMSWKNLQGVGLDRMERRRRLGMAGYISSIWDPALTWDAVDWLCELGAAARDQRHSDRRGRTPGRRPWRAGSRFEPRRPAFDGTLPTSELVEVVDAVAG